MAKSTWSERDLPVLEWVASVEEESGHTLYLREASEKLGLSIDELRFSLMILADAGYLATGSHDASGTIVQDAKLREKGRREVGQWPREAGYAALLAAIDRNAAEAEGAERSRLEKLRELIVDVGPSVIVKVLRDLATGA